MDDKKPIILIIDDDISLSEVLATKLNGSGFSSLEARDGKEGIEIAKKEKPDLILLDLRMPKMDGAEVLAELKKDSSTKKIKVLLLTLFNEISTMKLTKEAANKLGAFDFLEKTIDLDELVTRVRAALAADNNQK